jgi:hypothetical protein
MLGTVLTQSNFDYKQNHINILGIFYKLHEVEGGQVHALTFGSFLITSGLGAAISAVFTSGLAGVLCEYMLKAGSRDVSMSIRNVQLGVPSCLLGLVALHFQEEEELLSGSFLQGFTNWTWTVIVLHSLGRLSSRLSQVILAQTCILTM